MGRCLRFSEGGGVYECGGSVRPLHEVLNFQAVKSDVEAYRGCLPVISDRLVVGVEFTDQKLEVKSL